MTHRSTGLLAQLHDLDQHAFDIVAGWRSTPTLDATLPRISRFANHGVLWMTLVALSWVFGKQRHKRAAVRGLVSLGLASIVANGPTKFAFRRARPEFGRVPTIRALVHPPTTSFPSGHSASAAAFAVGYAFEAPGVAAPIGVLAAAVAVSRVYTGVHYPGDVIAGVSLGAAMAVLSTRIWPVVDQEAVSDQPRAVLPKRAVLDAADGDGVTFVVNPRSGRAAIGSIDAADVRAAFPEADIRVLDRGADPVDVLRPGAADAHILGVSGGDGTVIAGAQVAMAEDKPLAVAPGGTFNYFAHSLGIERLEDATAAVRGGETVSVDVGTMNGDTIFLNMASVGSYVEFVRERERLEPNFGKPLAMPIALIKVLARARPLRLRIDGKPVSAWLVFIGNCAYSPEGFAPTVRERLDDGLLDVRIIRSDRRFAALRVGLAALVGGLSFVRGGVYEERRVGKLEIESADGRPLRAAIDGEVVDAGRRISFAKRPRALRVVVPPDTGSSVA